MDSDILGKENVEFLRENNRKHIIGTPTGYTHQNYDIKLFIDQCFQEEVLCEF